MTVINPPQLCMLETAILLALHFMNLRCHFIASRRSALGRHLLYRRGCLCVCHVDILCPND